MAVICLRLLLTLSRALGEVACSAAEMGSRLDSGFPASKAGVSAATPLLEAPEGLLMDPSHAVASGLHARFSEISPLRTPSLIPGPAPLA
jgi:hypothetical protein